MSVVVVDMELKAPSDDGRELGLNPTAIVSS